MTAPLPPAVVEALSRACELVARRGSGWVVGGTPAGSGADALADALYAHWYTQPDVPRGREPIDPPLHRSLLVSALRAAQARPSTAPRGWTVMGSDPRGAVSAARPGNARMLRPGEYVMPLRPGVPPAPGEPIEPIAPLEHLDAERNLWWALTEPGPEPPIGRIYLDARPATAPRVVHEVTTALAERPFQLKCPIIADACERVDAVVVYHVRRSRQKVMGALLGRWATLGPLLDPGVPPLTRRVRRGVAWADDVEVGSSYGEARCRVLAQGIDAAAASWNAMGPDDRLSALVAALADAGVDPQHPWRVLA